LSAYHGAVAWTAYAVLECWFASVLPAIIRPEAEREPHNAAFLALLFLLYPILGAGLGVLSGFAIRAARLLPLLGRNARFDRLASSAATLTVLAAIGVNVAVHLDPRVLDLSILMLAVVLAIALLLHMGTSAWADRLAFMTNPWTASTLLLGLPWIVLDLAGGSAPRTTNAAATLIFVGAVLLVSALLHGILQRLRGRGSRDPERRAALRAVAGPALAALITLGVGSTVNEVAGFVTGTFAAPPTPVGGPNVVLITLDTVRADHLSVYGYARKTTPNLEKLAQSSTRYSHAFATGAMTLSTHASLFTGQYARRHGAHFELPGSPGGRPLSAEAHTLAEHLAEHGYLTLGVVSNYGFLSDDFGLAQGFEHYDARMRIPLLQPVRRYFLRQTLFDALEERVPRSMLDLRIRRAEEINSEAFRLLDRVRDVDRPFFLFLNYMDAHRPYLPPPPFDRLYLDGAPTLTDVGIQGMLHEVNSGEREMTAAERAELIDLYDGAIAYVDSQLGRLVGRLQDLGLYDDCLIIVTSDHGEAFGQRNLYEHGVSVYQDQISVPMIIHYPDDGTGRIVDAPVSSVDVMPTVLEVLGLESSNDLHGQNLLDVRALQSRSVFSESFPSGFLAALHPRFQRVQRAVISRRLKLVRASPGGSELYDLSADPQERRDLHAVHSATPTLESTLEDWLQSVAAPTAEPTNLDAETLERLRTLGYVE
jgi:arylsulfatase A-like enzyme